MVKEKGSRCDKIIHNAMVSTVEIHQNNKMFSVIVQPKNACKLEFAYNLWLLFINQTHSDILVFAIITFHIYNITVTKCKHGIGPYDIITFNEELNFFSTSIIELVNIDECSHKNEILIFITKNNLNKTKDDYVTLYDDGNIFEFFISKIII